jgi:hypothetical protein
MTWSTIIWAIIKPSNVSTSCGNLIAAPLYPANLTHASILTPSFSAKDFHLFDKNSHNGNPGRQMEGDYEGEEKCECAGCEKSAVHVCNGCGIASYCSELHMLEDWKNHAVECAYTINDVAGASHWAVEMEVGQDQEEWVRVPCR